MTPTNKLKEFLDWARRVHFVFWVAIPLIVGSSSTGSWAATSGIHLSIMWRISITLLVTALSFLCLVWLAARWDDKWGNRYIKLTDSQADKLLASVKRETHRATLLDHMGARARMLEAELEELWHRWDNVGEKLIHPLDPIDQIKGDDYSISWIRRDFLVRYGDHISTLKSLFPEFTSNALTGGYPSQREYVEVLRDLKNHAEKLESMAEEASRLSDHCAAIRGSN